MIDVYSSMDQPLMDQAGLCAEHVITGQLTELWTGPFLVDLPSFTSFRESYLFHSLNLGACSLHLIEWDRIDIVERWIDTDQSLHLNTDQKTIRDNLRRTSFDWWSTLCWVSIDHFYSWWNQRSSFEIFFIFDSGFYLYQSTLAVSQFESEFDQQTIYCFESRSIKFVSLRSQSTLSTFASRWILAKSAPQSEQFRSPHISQAVTFLQWRQILNHS
jgi:hypothetical protein